MATTSTEGAVKHLNSLLKGEISAVETYRKALGRLSDSAARGEIERCAQSHERSATLLRQRISSLGGQPAEGSGAWGAFAKVVQSGADAVSDKAAIAALEEGEDHGLKDYRRDLSDLDPESRRLVENDLLPAQQRTHATLSGLKKTIH